MLVLRLLPSALGAPVAARVVTRWRRRSVMLWSDLIRTGMALALPVVPWLVWVYFWAFLIEVVGLVFLPARDAAVPFLIEDDEEEHDTGTLEIANGITMATSYGMIPVGAGAFGLLLWLSNSAGWEGNWRYVLVFWLNAATYLVSYVAIRSIPDLGPGPRERRETAREAPHAGFLAALRLPVVRGCCRASRSWRWGWARCSRWAWCSCGTSWARGRSVSVPSWCCSGWAPSPGCC